MNATLIKTPVVCTITDMTREEGEREKERQRQRKRGRERLTV